MTRNTFIALADTTMHIKGTQYERRIEVYEGTRPDCEAAMMQAVENASRDRRVYRITPAIVDSLTIDGASGAVDDRAVLVITTLRKIGSIGS